MDKSVLKRFLKQHINIIIDPLLYQNLDILGIFLHGSYNRPYYDKKHSDIDLKIIHLNKDVDSNTVEKVSFKIILNGLTVDILSISEQLAIEGIEHSEFEIVEYIYNPLLIFNDDKYNYLLNYLNKCYNKGKYIKSILTQIKLDIRKGKFEDPREIDRIDFYLDEILSKVV